MRPLYQFDPNAAQSYVCHDVAPGARVHLARPTERPYGSRGLSRRFCYVILADSGRLTLLYRDALRRVKG